MRSAHAPPVYLIYRLGDTTSGFVPEISPHVYMFPILFIDMTRPSFLNIQIAASIRAAHV